tara:strand:+ start:810 stop:989 length:180 start_codon:yes stop_codon:yes gene_type:complete
MQLFEVFERIKNKKSFNTFSGTVYRIFEIHEREGKHIDNTPYVFIKPEVQEKKIKKLLN